MTGKEIVKIARRDLVQGRGHTDMMSDVKAAAMLDANPWAGTTLLLLLLLMAVGYLWASTADLDVVTVGSGRAFSSYGPGLDAYPPTSFRMTGLALPREVLEGRIADRLDSQMAAGFVDEVRALASAGEPLSRTARQALGYRELLSHLEGRCVLDDAVAETTRRTRAFARRQRAWFRRDPRITWMGADDANPLAVLPVLLGSWSDR